MRSRADLESIHRFSSRHRHLFPASEQAGCFYCLATFDPKEVEDWVDGEQLETGDTADGITALCPKCGIDSVIPSAAPVRFDATLLPEMHAYWFENRPPAI